MNDVLGLMEPTSPTSLEYSLFSEVTGGTGRGATGRGLSATHSLSQLALSQDSGCYVSESLQYLSR
jgi:hypothetical protein